MSHISHIVLSWPVSRWGLILLAWRTAFTRSTWTSSIVQHVATWGWIAPLPALKRSWNCSGIWSLGTIGLMPIFSRPLNIYFIASTPGPDIRILHSKFQTIAVMLVYIISIPSWNWSTPSCLKLGLPIFPGCLASGKLWWRLSTKTWRLGSKAFGRVCIAMTCHDPFSGCFGNKLSWEYPRWMPTDASYLDASSLLPICRNSEWPQHLGRTFRQLFSLRPKICARWENWVAQLERNFAQLVRNSTQLERNFKKW